MNEKKHVGPSLAAKVAAILAFGAVTLLIAYVNMPSEPSPNGPQTWLAITMTSAFAFGILVARRHQFDKTQIGILGYIGIGLVSGLTLGGLIGNGIAFLIVMILLIATPIIIDRSERLSPSRKKPQNIT